MLAGISIQFYSLVFDATSSQAAISGQVSYSTALYSCIPPEQFCSWEGVLTSSVTMQPHPCYLPLGLSRLLARRQALSSGPLWRIDNQRLRGGACEAQQKLRSLPVRYFLLALLWAALLQAFALSNGPNPGNWTVVQENHTELQSQRERGGNMPEVRWMQWMACMCYGDRKKLVM